MKKTYWEVLPRFFNGNREGKIDWKSSIGHQVKIIYDDEEFYIKIVDFERNKKRYLTVMYNDKEFEISIGNFTTCKCGKIINKYTKEFKINIGKTYIGSNRNMTIIDREYRRNNGTNRKYYKYRCNKCNNEDYMEESNILKGKGCNACGKYRRKAVLGINTIWDTDRWMCDLGVSEEDAKTHTRSNNSKIYVTCPDCGNVKNMVINNIYNYKSICCPCGDGKSYPEKFINSMLIQLNADFSIQYSPNYFKIKDGDKIIRKYSDFYITSMHLIIEADGRMGHEGGIVHSKSDKTLEELIAVDKWKDEQHALHGIKTIRIDCFESDCEYIKNNVLNSELVNYFDLSNVNWLECEKFALSNIVKEVCDYWTQKEEWETTNTLSECFKISQATIAKYLKKGVKLGWCEYDAKGEQHKARTKNGKLGCKRVLIYKDDICLGEFNSIIELEKESEKLFGVRLDHSNISAVCLGKYKTLKGYRFEYAKELL